MQLHLVLEGHVDEQLRACVGKSGGGELRRCKTGEGTSQVRECGCGKAERVDSSAACRVGEIEVTANPFFK